MGARRAVVAALGLLALGSGCAGGEPWTNVARHLTAAELGTPFTLPELTLPAVDAVEFDVKESLQGMTTLLFFGYSYCPDVCPIALAVSRNALDALDPRDRERVQILFVSVDPGRDTIERLAEWTEALGGGIHAVRPSQTELDAMYGAMGFRLPPTTSYEPFEEGGDEAYLVPHPTALYVVTSDGLGRFQYSFGRATSEEIAADLSLLIDERP